MHSLFILLALAFAAPRPAPLPAQPALASEPAPAQVSEIKDEVDRSIRWLRSTQDAKTGAFGHGVEGTAWALVAMAECPRAYERSDGPFMTRALDFLASRAREDGAICDAHAEGAARVEQTRIAARALSRLVDESSSQQLAGALTYLARLEIDDPDPGGPVAPAERAAAERRAAELLAQRDARGAWSGEEGDVIATGRAIAELSAIYSRWKPAAVAHETTPLPEIATVDSQAIRTAIERGAGFLVEAAQEGRFGAPGQPDAGLTAMVLGGLAAVPEPRPQAVQQCLDAGCAWLAGLQHEDGSIHDGKLANYVTSAAILALSRSGQKEYEPVILRARDFLIELQADEGEGYTSEHQYYGGIGYGDDERPDLSNLQVALEALSASGLSSEHAAYKRALTFLQRCQNRSESNDIELVVQGQTLVSGDDGGAAYQPGNSKAGTIELPDGRQVPRSYGSMSYALLKGYIFAGLQRDDPRVQALWKWLQQNYTLDINPGFEHSSDPAAAFQGLFYYFHTMAKALDLFGEDVIVDGFGVEHSWRSELSGRLLAMQSKIDGSWINRNSPRWWEGNPLLATAYVLMTLDSAMP